jgi:hypothetical protein
MVAATSATVPVPQYLAKARALPGAHRSRVITSIPISRATGQNEANNLDPVPGWASATFALIETMAPTKKPAVAIRCGRVLVLRLFVVSGV